MESPRGGLSKGVKMVAWARAVRWTGWGFGEALIPIFIFGFVGTFAEAGLIRSVYEMIMLLSLPLIGAWADRVSARKIMLVALFLYPLVGVSYFLAGIWGAAIFIVVARALNGFLWSADSIGVSTYYRRASKAGSLGRAFGYLESWSMFGWTAAAIASAIIAWFVPLSVHWLLFIIAPFSLVAFLMVRRVPEDAAGSEPHEHRRVMARSYLDEFAEWRSWDLHLWLLSALVLFIGFVQSLIWFFIPIDAYIEGANISLVITLSVVASLPVLFGYWLGKVADKIHGYRLIVYGLLISAALVCVMAVFPAYAMKLVISFLLGIVIELFGIIQSKLVTTLGPAESYGRRGSAFESIGTLGDLSAPLVLGIAFDAVGFGVATLVLASASLIFALAFASLSHHTHRRRIKARAV